ncbi:unnamed protein product [Chrysodeixis includens]|uniref:Uncharacterized protein n=1 Tax=Chrysodeixis includens TaxID=689277 RepID=A0A9N8KYK0_CHRIL|nr:unnamed protein product [Chrysodeixis includens]
MTKVKTSHAQKKRLARYSPCRPPLASSSDTLRTNCEARASPVAYIMKRSEAQTSNATGRHKKKMPRNESQSRAVLGARCVFGATALRAAGAGRVARALRRRSRLRHTGKSLPATPAPRAPPGASSPARAPLDVPADAPHASSRTSRRLTLPHAASSRRDVELLPPAPMPNTFPLQFESTCNRSRGKYLKRAFNVVK